MRIPILHLSSIPAGAIAVLRVAIPGTLGLCLLFSLIFSPMVASNSGTGYWGAFAIWWGWALRILPLVWAGVLLVAWAGDELAKAERANVAAPWAGAHAGTGEVLLLFGDPNAREATPVDVEFTCEDRRREDPCPICGKPREEEV